MNRVKVAAHVHSEWSYDAAWSLPALARSFGRRGFDVVLMSEHDNGFDHRRWGDYRRACAAASMPGLLLVPGIEYGDPDNVVHLPVWGDVPFLGSGLSSAEVLRRAADVDGFTVFAHPWRREAWKRFEPGWLPHLSAVEIWNRKYDGWAPNRAALDLARRHALPPLVSLDFHTRRQFFPLGLSLDVDGSITRDAVVDGLRSGRFEPVFATRSALAFTAGIPGRTLQALEQARRRAAALLRRRG